MLLPAVYLCIFSINPTNIDGTLVMHQECAQQGYSGEGHRFVLLLSTHIQSAVKEETG